MQLFISTQHLIFGSLLNEQWYTAMPAGLVFQNPQQAFVKCDHRGGRALKHPPQPHFYQQQQQRCLSTLKPSRVSGSSSKTVPSHHSTILTCFSNCSHRFFKYILNADCSTDMLSQLVSFYPKWIHPMLFFFLFHHQICTGVKMVGSLFFQYVLYIGTKEAHWLFPLTQLQLICACGYWWRHLGVRGLRFFDCIFYLQAAISFH